MRRVPQPQALQQRWQYGEVGQVGGVPQGQRALQEDAAVAAAEGHKADQTIGVLRVLPRRLLCQNRRNDQSQLKQLARHHQPALDPLQHQSSQKPGSHPSEAGASAHR